MKDHQNHGSLLDAARQARRNAYSPYSRVRVGAAVETDTGEVFTGCNIENASYSLTLCAERSAAAAAVSAGHTRLRRVALAFDNAGPRAEEAIVPCGACLQFLAEFAGPELVIAIDGGGEFRLSDLLVSPFRFRK